MQEWSQFKIVKSQFLVKIFLIGGTSSVNKENFYVTVGSLIMKQFDNFPLIEISGPPMERGFQYGEQAKDKINFSIELYSKSLRDLGLKKGWNIEFG